MIEKKFNMFSTKEWLQFLQYKISPEREKELMDKASSDSFLREAVEAISTQENRPVSFQSLSYLISQVEDATGVSESNITSEKIRRRVDPDMNKKLILIIGGIFLAGLIAFGIYYFISNRTEVIDAEASNEIESIPQQEMVDTSSRPFDIIPTSTPVVDSIAPTPVNTPTQSTPKKKVNTASTSSSSYTTSPSYTEPKTTAVVATTPTPPQASAPARSNQVSKERELFNQAQDMFKQGNRDGAKQILNQLNSYDNPMKSQSGKILENMNSAGN